MKFKDITLFASVAVLCTASGQAMAETTWSLFTPFTTNDKPTELYREFAADVEEATGGELKIEVYSSGELPYKNTDILKALATDQVQIADLALGPVAGDVPELTVFGLPFLCTSSDGFYKAMDVALPTISKRLQDKFKVRALAGWTMPPQQIWLREGIDDIAGLEGRKIRTWNKMQAEMLDLMGASGVAVTPAEVIPALQRGVVDGAITAVIPAYDWKFYEVAEAGYMLNVTMTDQLIAVNGAAFEALAPETQEALATTAKAWQDEFKQAIDAAAGEAAEKLEAEGMTLITPGEADFAAAQEATQSLWAAWAENNGEIASTLLKDVKTACAN